jgi:hypothetical protein
MISSRVELFLWIQEKSFSESKGIYGSSIQKFKLKIIIGFQKSDRSIAAEKGLIFEGRSKINL